MDVLETITITMLGTDRKLLMDIVHEAKRNYLTKVIDQVPIFFPDEYCYSWGRTLYRKPRPLNTVLLADNIADMLVKGKN